MTKNQQRNQLEHTQSSWAKMATRIAELELENERLQREVFTNRMYRVRTTTSGADVFARCQAIIFTGARRCKKKAEREGLCGQHFQMRWGHQWFWNDACDLCGQRKDSKHSLKCPSKGGNYEDSQSVAAAG